MTRRLAFVAAAGLIGSVVFLMLGIGLSAQNFRDMPTLWGSWGSTCGPSLHTPDQVVLPFDVVDSLEINLPATVRYQRGPKAELVINGDQSLLNHVEMEDGKLSLSCEPGRHASRLDVHISGPAIKSWNLNGNVELALSNIDQPQLRLGIRGSGSVSATGTAQSVNLDISGTGDATLKGLVTQSAKIDIRGSGNAQITAQISADVSISGSGNIELFGNGVLRRSEIRGNGHVTQLP